jgi:TRAP-type C4-dicarboxylate transport system permease small subunit
LDKERKLVEDVVERFAPWRWLHTLFKIATIAFLMATVASIFMIVLLRYVFHFNLYGMDEILTIVSMWLYFMGGIYGTYEESHIQGDLLNLAWTKRWQYKAHKIYIYVVCVFLMLLWSYWGVKYFNNCIGSARRNTATKLPFWINQIPIPIGMWGMLLYSVYHLIRNIINPVSSHMTREEKDAAEKKALGIDGLAAGEEEVKA